MNRSAAASLFLALGMLAVSQACADGFNKAGRTSFQFVKIGIGARQTSLGEASVAFVNDANATFWNPAGIGGIVSSEASFSYARWFANMDYFSGAAGVRIGDIGVVAVGVSSLKYGDIKEALAVGSVSDTRTGNTFTGSNMMATLSFAHRFSDALWIGVTGKYLQEKLFLYSTSAIAFDVGTNYDTGFKGIRFGMSFQNFSKSVRYLSSETSDRQDEGYDIPLVYRVGVCANLISESSGIFDVGEDHRLTLCLESVNSNDYGDRWHIGAEYSFAEHLFLRGGYRVNYDEGNLSVGVGVQQRVAGTDLRLDYSFVSYEFLESPHRLTLSIGF
jgi:hypothetical protein